MQYGGLSEWSSASKYRPSTQRSYSGPSISVGTKALGRSAALGRIAWVTLGKSTYGAPARAHPLAGTHQLSSTGIPSAYPDALCTPMTARW